MPRVIKENLSWLIPLAVALTGSGIALYVKAQTEPRLATLEVQQQNTQEDIREIKRGIDRLINMHLEPRR